MCCGWTFSRTFWFKPFLLQTFVGFLALAPNQFYFYIFLYKNFNFSFHIILFCMCPLPPPPHISLFKLYVLFSLLGFGGEMLIDLTFSFCSFTPPPPFLEHKALILSLDFLYKEVNFFIYPPPPHSPEHKWASVLSFICQYLYIFANIFVQYIFTFFLVCKSLSIFRKHYANFGHFYKHFRAAFNIVPCLGPICPSQYMWISSDAVLQYVSHC